MKEAYFYIAGVLDSGCQITMERRGNHYRAVVTISRKSIECLKVIQDQFGGTINKLGNSFRFRFKSQDARRLLAAIGPLMKTRKREIDIVLRLHLMSGQIRNQSEQEMLYKCMRGEAEWFE